MMTDSSDTGTDSTADSTAANWLQEQLQQWQETIQANNPAAGDPWQSFLKSIQAPDMTDFSDQQANLIDLVKSQTDQFSQFTESLLQSVKLHTGSADSETSGSENPPLNTEALVDQFQGYMKTQCNDLLSRQWNMPEPLASLLKNSALTAESLKSAPMRDILEQLAKSPEIGSGSYSPAQMRSLAQACIDYQDALGDYLQQYDHIFSQTGDDLKQLLQQQNTEIDSIKGLQNLWVECYEKAYRDTVFTDQYQNSHGRISNSLNQVRKLAFNSRDKKLKELGLVTREELDSAIRQQHKMRKQVRKQQQEIDELRSMLTELKSQMVSGKKSSRGKSQ
ncbi:poly(R)-hydroxyalkanoic acid synthase subunit PhaE [Amphritea sp.]|uniref:poly(R)-hydroxyalkanoic acid synthase subunit PhaE n=1 Tax=Amphritea sp. TaxID=1872502 RepID=UPI0025C21105|nr:poly(R)-hydroxyalkanoic acid synthase subunit PhaE [Amphritea sp.]